jgi:transcriptional regulator with XRE-family HTH domain
MIEREISNPSLDTLNKIAFFFDLKINDLFVDLESEKNKKNPHLKRSFYLNWLIDKPYLIQTKAYYLANTPHIKVDLKTVS